MSRRYRLVSLAAACGLLLSVAACNEDGSIGSLPSTRPSIDVSVDRTADNAPTEEPTRTQEPEPEPTRTQEPEPTRTQEPEPTRTQEPEPTRTQEPEPEPTRTQEPEPEPTETETETPTPAATSSSAAAVPVAEEDDAGFLPWLLVFLLIGAVIAIVVISRSRRVAVWDAEASTLTSETRNVIGVRLPPVLTAPTAGDRGLAWPPVRDDLLDLSGRWGSLAARSVDDAQQATATGAAIMLRDLVTAFDAENEALAAGRDWRMLRPKVNSILDALNAHLNPQPLPPTYPGQAPGGPPSYPSQGPDGPPPYPGQAPGGPPPYSA
ncbi:hypothetical protein AB0M02_14275 [Actinoplanes sp. NPDC051861]|uniref:hypothetical protein n=1 Tax=Actinoplanes sp. NPDC051861 TaxID=3155170 RepID=UPI00343702F3